MRRGRPLHRMSLDPALIEKCVEDGVRQWGVELTADRPAAVELGRGVHDDAVQVDDLLDVAEADLNEQVGAGRELEGAGQADPARKGR